MDFITRARALIGIEFNEHSMATIGMNNHTDSIIDIRLKAVILNENPQDLKKTLLDNKMLLRHYGYTHSSKIISSLTETSSGSFEDIFDEHKIRITTDGSNTIMIFSERPFNIEIKNDPLNEAPIFANVYHFAFTGEDEIEVYVSNHSTEFDVTLNYLLAEADPEGSSYVYT